jgi:hypothetical protein
LESPHVESDAGKDGLVRVYLSEKTMGTRTVQPTLDAIAAYRLTFSGGGSHDPVDITGSDYADVELDDGAWTITAKAYKQSGTLGNTTDEIAMGSVTITLSGGAVATGAATVIILGPSGSGSGTLRYNITLTSGTTGELKLWDIDNVLVSDFGSNGTLMLSTSTTDDYTVAAGRYIAEVKLTDSEGRIAFRREVVEVWVETVSDFVFAPAEFLNPNAGEAGVYLGIISFDEYVHELTIDGPVFLNKSNVAILKNLLQTGYNQNPVGGTALYYAVHKALANLKTMESSLPEDLEQVAVVTFTDSLDQHSYARSMSDPLEDQRDITNENYEEYLSREIASRTIKGQNITAYSVGVMGSDISSNEPDFLSTIKSIASTGIANDGEPYYTKLTDWDDLDHGSKPFQRA